jgi:hypothetical protein
MFQFFLGFSNSERVFLQPPSATLESRSTKRVQEYLALSDVQLARSTAFQLTYSESPDKDAMLTSKARSESGRLLAIDDTILNVCLEILFPGNGLVLAHWKYELISRFKLRILRFPLQLDDLKEIVCRFSNFRDPHKNETTDM